ncbi:site-2 protease family protein [Thermaerobacter litoralis]
MTRPAPDARRRGPLHLGSFLGVAVFVHPLLLVLVALAAVLGLPGQLLLLLAVLATHELAHLIAARLCGLEIARLEFLPYGAVADIRGPGRREPLVEAVVALAGPLNNLLLLAGSIALHQAGWLQGPWVAPFQAANLTMALFNLLPALPLDGGRILLAFLKRTRGPRQAVMTLGRLGRGVAVALAAATALAFYWQVLAPHLLAASVTIWVGTAREEQWVGVTALRGLWTKRGRLRRVGLLPVHRLIALETTSLRQVAEALRPGSYHEIVVVDGQQRTLGEVDEGLLLRGILQLGLDAPVRDLLEWRP